MSELVKSESETNVAPQARESISKTMLKKIRALSKNELVEKLVAVSNYAEEMKAANMILMYQVKQLNDKLNGTTNGAEQEKERSNANS